MATRSETGEPSLLERLGDVGITRGVVLLGLLWVVAVGPLVHDLSAQGAPRVALTGALVDDGDIKIDQYLLGVDRTDRDGHVYSDKAPGQPVLAVPAYAAARAIGAEPAIVPRVSENLTLWWVTVVSAGLPLVALLALIAATAHRAGTPIPLPALATLAFGTMLLPFSINLYGHVLAATLGYAAWSVLERRDGWRRGLIGGALAGLAVAVEYPLVLVAVVLGLWLVGRRRWTALAGFSVAGLPMVVALLLYQRAAFGSPFSVGYTDKPNLRDSTLFITGIPMPDTLAAMLVGSRGLFVFTPIVLVGMIGLVRRWRQRRNDASLVAAAIVVLFLLLQAGWPNPWGGDGPGPRYVVPMIPFLGLGLAAIWADVPARVRQVVVAVSIVSMGLSTITYHLVPRGSMLIAAPLEALGARGVVSTVWTMGLGPFGWVVHLGTIAAVLVALARQRRQNPEPVEVVATVA